MRHPCGPADGPTPPSRRHARPCRSRRRLRGAGLAPGERAPARRRALPQRRATRDAVPARRDPLARAGAGRAADAVDGRGGGRAWKPVQEAAEDAPDSGSAERRTTRGWRVGAPVWVGRAIAVEVRTVGRVTRARALTVRSPVSRVPFRVVASPGVPRLVARAAWQADETIVKGKPSYADTLRMAHVHHTAGTNTYTRLQAPAVVRAIQLYHVKGNGWNDIGYNALVDRFGTVYEGRAGGIDRNVVGAHARGFNTGSFGIAVMGDYRTVEPPAAAVDALVRTLAWRLDLAHVDPLATFNGISSGNERFGVGIPVFLRDDLRAPGHRADDLPRRAALRTARRHRATGRRARPAEALRAARRRGRVGRDPLPRPRLLGTRLVGRRDRRCRHGARPRPGHRGSRRLDVATDRARPRGHALAHRDARRDVRRGHARRRRRPPPCSSPPRRPRRPRSRPTATGRRTRRRSPSRSPSTRTSPCR